MAKKSIIEDLLNFGKTKDADVITSGSSSPFDNGIVLKGKDVHEYLKDNRKIAPEDNRVLDRVLKLIGREGTRSVLKDDVLQIMFSDEEKTVITIDFRNAK